MKQEFFYVNFLIRSESIPNILGSKFSSSLNTLWSDLILDAITMMGFRFNNIINRFLPFSFHEWFPSTSFEPIDTGRTLQTEPQKHGH